MKKLFRSSKFYYLLLAFLVIFVGFYWFQLRPAQIKHACSQTVSKTVKEKASQGDDLSIQQATSLYDFCLHDKGL